MYHLIAAVFISGKRLVDSYIGVSASSYGSDVPIKRSLLRVAGGLSPGGIKREEY